MFDTLVTRPFADPADLFECLHRSEPAEFRKARVRAEYLAREIQYNEDGSREVNLSDIYHNVSSRFRNNTRDIEFETECKLLRPRLFVKDLYDYAHSVGKRVIVVSDTYFSPDEIRRLLDYCGFQRPSAVYTSSETKGGKYDGLLFDHALFAEQCEASDILHLGDNRKSDLHSPLTKGICAIQIPSQLELLYRDAAFNLGVIDHVSKTPGLFGSQIVARLARLREEGEMRSVASMFGHMYAGPLLFGFAHWLADQATLSNIDHLLLIARDGWIIRDALQIVAPKIKTSVVEVSRRTCVLPTLFDDPSAIHVLVPINNVTTLADLLPELFENGDQLLDACVADDIDIDVPVGGVEDIEKLRSVLEANRHLVDSQISSEIAGLRAYLEKFGITSPRVALVDTGWGLTCHKALEAVLGHRVKGLYFGTRAGAYLHSDIISWVINDGDNSDWTVILRDAVELVELCFASDRDQVERITLTPSGDLTLHYRPISAFERNRRMMVAEIQEAIVGFCSELANVSAPIEIDGMRGTITKMFSALSSYPTPAEFWTLGDILHDRYVHGGRFHEFRDFWRTAISGPRAAQNSVATRRGLVKAFNDLRRSAGLRVALRKAYRYLRHELVGAGK